MSEELKQEKNTIKKLVENREPNYGWFPAQAECCQEMKIAFENCLEKNRNKYE